MDYELLRWAMLPDLVVVIGVFGALGLDYGWLRNRALSKRNSHNLQPGILEPLPRPCGYAFPGDVDLRVQFRR